MLHPETLPHLSLQNLLHLRKSTLPQEVFKTTPLQGTYIALQKTAV